MSKENNTEAVTVQNETVQESRMVTFEQYETLYNQAKALETRYRRLFELYNALLEKYLDQK